MAYFSYKLNKKDLLKEQNGIEKYPKLLTKQRGLYRLICCNCVHWSQVHRTMMVDPMFMVVQNIRLFLVAVTPTAVAPIAVTL